MPDRREVLAALAALGVGTPTFQRALAAQAPGPITAEMVQAAEWVAGVALTEAQRKQVAQVLAARAKSLEELRKVDVPYDVAPAFHFTPTPGEVVPASRGQVTLPKSDAKKPAGDELAYLGIAELAHLLRTKQVSSVELTKFFLARLEKYDPVLKCVVTRTDELAMKQAMAADAAFAAGKDFGPLHGIPWGAKDLIAYPGYPTTWGAEHYKTQTLAGKATVAERLDAGGAVLVAKLTLGALALGDQWFGGLTRNPWNPKQGSSGSSAGPASAAVAGCVPFGLGSETLGSIVSPSTRCGATGLRPTFGRISRHGCMALSWTLDKLGPLCRSAEDCALVFGSIHGADGRDASAVDRPFVWPCPTPLKLLRVGYVEGKLAEADRKVLEGLGVQLKPVTLPDELPVGPMQLILRAECAAAFDAITRAGVAEGLGLWPVSFREGRFISAVDYIQANRVRTLLIRAWQKAFAAFDVFAGNELGLKDLLLAMNLTGRPAVCLPNGFRSGVPTAMTFTGKPFGESELLAVAHAYQGATGHHRKRPVIET